jgi:hypothetical protein
MRLEPGLADVVERGRFPHNARGPLAAAARQVLTHQHPAAEAVPVMGVPVLARMRPEPGLADVVERGRFPHNARGPLAAAARQVLTHQHPAAEAVPVIGVPVLARMRPEPGLADAVERGRFPRNAKGPLAAAARLVLKELRP